MKECKNCKRQFSDDNKFCPNCGAELDVIQETEQAAQSPFQPQQQYHPNAYTPMPNVEQGQEAVVKKRFKPKTIVIAIVLVIAIVVTAVLVMPNSSTDDTSGSAGTSGSADTVVSEGFYHTVYLNSDGTVTSTAVTNSKCDWGQTDVSGWSDIVAVSAGYCHTVGLRSDGTVLSTSITNGGSDYGQTDVGSWTDIVAVSAGWSHTVGLKSDGTVVSTAVTDSDSDYGQTDVSSWTDIVAISAGTYHTVGLKSDGTVVSTTIRGDYFDSGQAEVSSWTDIIAVSTGGFNTVGLKSDGTVVSTAVSSSDTDFGQAEVSSWTDIVAVSAGLYHTVGLKSDGTVVSTAVTDSDYDLGQSNVGGWSDIVAISATGNTVGLKSDGTMVSTEGSGTDNQEDSTAAYENEYETETTYYEETTSSEDLGFYYISDFTDDNGECALIGIEGYNLSEGYVYFDANTSGLYFSGGFVSTIYSYDEGFENAKRGRGPYAYTIVSNDGISFAGDGSVVIDERVTGGNNYIVFKCSAHFASTSENWYVPVSIIDWDTLDDDFETSDGHSATRCYLK